MQWIEKEEGLLPSAEVSLDKLGKALMMAADTGATEEIQCSMMLEVHLSCLLANRLNQHVQIANNGVVECEKEAAEFLKNFFELGARMSVKIHFLQSHSDYLPQNCGA